MNKGNFERFDAAKDLLRKYDNLYRYYIHGKDVDSVVDKDEVLSLVQEEELIVSKNSDFVYFLYSEKHHAIKIGITANIKHRRREIERKVQDKLHILCLIPASVLVETNFHLLCENYIKTEMYELGTEWFQPSKYVMACLMLSKLFLTYYQTEFPQNESYITGCPSLWGVYFEKLCMKKGSKSVKVAYPKGNSGMPTLAIPNNCIQENVLYNMYGEEMIVVQGILDVRNEVWWKGNRLPFFLVYHSDMDYIPCLLFQSKNCFGDHEWKQFEEVMNPEIAEMIKNNK